MHDYSPGRSAENVDRDLSLRYRLNVKDMQAREPGGGDDRAVWHYRKEAFSRANRKRQNPAGGAGHIEREMGSSVSDNRNFSWMHGGDAFRRVESSPVRAKTNDECIKI